MKKILSLLFILCAIYGVTNAQAIKIPISVSDDVGHSKTLYFGLDPSATDGLDTSLGEATLPPAFTFDARFKLPVGTDESWADYRYGTHAPYNAVKTYTIKIKPGDLSTKMIFSWNLPAGITGVLTDPFGGNILNASMNGPGSAELTNLALSSLTMTITYNLIHKYIVITSNSNPAAGSNVTITAQLTDENGNSLSTSNKIITWSKTGTDGIFNSATSTTDGTGKATVIFTVGQITGTIYNITATDNSSPAITGISGNITVIAGPAAKYEVNSSDINPIAGSNVTINAQLMDQYNNNVTTVGKTITWSKTGTGGSFSSSTSTTNSSGIATVTFTAGRTAGTVYEVTGTDNSSPALTGTSGDITVIAGSASKYVVTSSDNNPTAGSNVTITTQLTDQYNNNVMSSNKTITWSKTGTGGTFNPTTSTTDGTGKTTVTFTVSQIASVQTVIATDNSSPAITGTSGNITVKAGAASKYVVTSSNYSPTAGSNVVITAQLTDQYNNNVTTANKTITWSKTGAGGTFNPAISTTAVTGKATTTFTTSSATGTIYTLTATDGNGLNGTSSNITTSSGLAAKYIVTTSNDNPAAGSSIIITAQLADSSGFPKSGSGKVITWEKMGNGGSFSVPTSTTNSSGTATVTFTVSQLSGTVNIVTVTDNSSPVLTGISGDITVKTGAASKYVVFSSDNNPVAGSSVAISAQLTDQCNNNVSAANKIITWSKTGRGGTFNQATSSTDGTGKATVTFEVSQTASVQTVIATDDSSPALTGTSGSISVIAEAASKYLVGVSRNNPAVGDTVTVTAQLSDQYGNSISTPGKTVT